MELCLFNSLENKITKLNFQPNQTINFYLCGPTVYDHVHLGNLRPVIIFDVLYRLLLHHKAKVNYVQNITDIDDRIIAKAKQENKAEKAISRYYTKSYLTILTRYNILSPIHLPKVTDYIFPIQEFIATLLKKGGAYQYQGEVFFRIGENQEYGKLSGQKLEKLRTGTREITQTNKESSQDFVLWKNVSEGITWNSPWGPGRPGWHTECVVFIQKIFSEKTIDIHGGGNDLLFPHHENERIQYLTANNHELSKIWVHVAHIHWQKEKMSKSIGNVILAQDFAKEYGVNVFRYLVLNTHYNQVINFDQKLIQQGVNYIQKIENLLKKLGFYLYTEKIKIKKNAEKPTEVISSLLNNLNTVKVLYYWEKIITSLNKSISQNEKGENFQTSVSNFYFISNILGFKFKLPVYNSRIKLLIKEWQELRANGKYSSADEIRTQLQKLNIV